MSYHPVQIDICYFWGTNIMQNALCLLEHDEDLSQEMWAISGEFSYLFKVYIINLKNIITTQKKI